MKRPSVLFINRVYPPMRGATGRVLHDLAKGFAAEGWHVTIVTSGKKPESTREGAIRVVRVRGKEKPTGLFSYFSIWARLYYAALGQDKPDLLITLSDPPLLAYAGYRLKKAKKCRHIHWCHDLYPDILPVLGIEFPDFLQQIFAKLAHKALHHADRVVVIGRCMARRLTYKGLSPKNITMIPNWPNSELIQQPIHENSAAHKTTPARHYSDISKPFEDQLKTAPKFRVLYAGTLGLAHPYATIIDAAKILKESAPEIEFVFVGDGAGFEKLAKEREKHSLENMRFLPFQPAENLKQLMESGDVHLISMSNDAAGFLVPSKLYSALAAHRPCLFIGPEASEAAKVIQDFKAGTIIPHGKAQDLAARIKHYRTNAREWHAACDGARAAAEIYTQKDAIDAFIERAWGAVKEDIDVTEDKP